jgi:hypothetical protein
LDARTPRTLIKNCARCAKSVAARRNFSYHAHHYGWLLSPPNIQDVVVVKIDRRPARPACGTGRRDAAARRGRVGFKN